MTLSTKYQPASPPQIPINSLYHPLKYRKPNSNKTNLYQPPHIPRDAFRLVACKPQQRCQKVLALDLNIIVMISMMIQMMMISDIITEIEPLIINHLCRIRSHLLTHAIVGQRRRGCVGLRRRCGGPLKEGYMLRHCLLRGNINRKFVLFSPGDRLSWKPGSRLLSSHRVWPRRTRGLLPH